MLAAWLAYRCPLSAQATQNAHFPAGNMWAVSSVPAANYPIASPWWEILRLHPVGGAIAGEIDGEYTGNRFVSDTLAGVDRVSLSGKAEQISYAALKELENIPEDFLHLTLRFVADNTVLTEQEFNYGDSFSEEIYPQAPDKDGFYIHWDRTNLSDLRFDTVVTAEYEPYITTLSSEDKREGHPSVLAEGNFQEGVSLQAEAADNPASLLDGAAEVWTLTIPDVGQESHTVRWRFPAGDASYTIYEKKNDRWKKVSSEAVGQYLCFELSGNQFAAVPSTANCVVGMGSSRRRCDDPEHCSAAPRQACKVKSTQKTYPLMLNS